MNPSESRSQAPPGNALLARLCLALFIACLVPQPACAQRAPVDPPLLGRPDDFSNIVGRYQTPRVEAFPTEVHVEEPITLRITITGVGPAKYEPRREHLKLFPDAWDKQFYVEEMRHLDLVDPSKKSWLFVYRLRPKHTKVDAINDIKLVYYNPEVSKFETRYADGVPIVVKPRMETKDEPILDKRIAPDSFYQTAPIDSARSSLALTTTHLVGCLAVPPLLCVLGASVWKRIRPSEVERRRRVRGEAAANAIAQLRAEAAPVWDILSRYLRDRFEIAFEEPTPAEVSAALLRHGFAKDLCARCAAMLRTCDALRFAKAAPPTTLAGDAASVIAALEADPCAR